MIEAEIIADSENTATGDRITTYVLRYPRFIHAELMTHRVFSRNAASSRAIPVTRQMEEIRQRPALPAEWGLNRPGMQATDALDGPGAMVARDAWLRARDRVLEQVEILRDLGVHKQVVNRLLEPWSHITTLVTATEWGNFFRLRAHPDAQPEFQELAYGMLRLYLEHRPAPLEPGEWHIPFGDRMPQTPLLDLQQQLRISVARAARISYLTFEGEIDVVADILLHDRLLLQGHMSPFEHQARAARRGDTLYRSNFRGWEQYRTLLEPRGRHDRPGPRELRAILDRRPRR